jgi:hypothetical protein
VTWRWCYLALVLGACRRERATVEGTAQEALAKPSAVASIAQPLPSPAAAVPTTSSRGPADPCEAELEAARLELLRRGFAPVEEPAQWLRVSRVKDDLSLSLVMRTSADGAATWYRASLSRRVGSASPWQRKLANYCCDEHANPEDNLRELSWRRRSTTLQAQISIVYFARGTRSEDMRDRGLFEDVVKKALDACLTVSGP